jgi:drug/metabolite transporter (DMT)-like permease
VPVFGLIWSAIFLHEPLGAGLFVGLALILASVALVTGTLFYSRPASGTGSAL